MDYILIILGFLCLLLGFIGCIAPGLPGIPLSWLGLLLTYMAPTVQINYYLLIITFILALVISVADFLIPGMGAKRFGGSKYGIWGANLGIVVGLFFPPWGILIGPFAGALVGELLYDFSDTSRAFKASAGAFLGFLAGTFIKIVTALSFTLLYLYIVIKWIINML
ncbi:DUF456 domain-containing protein [Capnocytophaga canimorsus]|uniref:DUF456 domain-containing protein n=1 Tax=Capnocytophaga canimorsus TaxID=28188 RepID=UPI0037D2B139